MSKIVLITGASSGFGRLTAEAIAKAGHVVYGSMRQTATRNAPVVEQMAAFSRENHVDLRALELDVQSQDSVDAAVKKVIAEQGRIDVLMIDLVVLSIPVILAYVFIAVFGLITLGLGWLLFWLVWPASVIWAIIYYGASLGGPHSATLGMRAMDLELRTWYGAPGYFVLGAMHGVLFWISVSMLTPLVLLIGPFNSRRRLLHDLILGTIVINSSVRTQVAQPARTF